MEWLDESIYERVANKTNSGQMFLKFDEITQKDSGAIYNTIRLSNGLLQYAENAKLKFVKFGVDKRDRRILIQLNNDKGMYLLNGKQEYRKHGIGAGALKSALLDIVKDLSHEHRYYVKRLDNVTFKLYEEVEENTIDTKNFIEDKVSESSIKWAEEWAYAAYRSVANRPNTGQMFLKFDEIVHGNSGTIYNTLRLSNNLLQYVKNAKQKFMKFGVDESDGRVVIQLNKDKGIYLLNSKQKYRKDGIGASVLSSALLDNVKGFNPECRYYAERLDDVTFKLYVENETNAIDTKNVVNDEALGSSINWLSEEEHGANRIVKREKPVIRFNVVGKEPSRYTINFSIVFYNQIKGKKYTHLELGTKKEENILYIRFNNKGKGINLCGLKGNSKGKLRQSGITATQLILHLKNQLNNFQTNYGYVAEEVEKDTYKIQI